MNVRYAGIITKINDPEVRRNGECLADWFGRQGIRTAIDRIEEAMDILVILGGDGTLLHVAEEAARHDIPVVGVNWGSLGFLTEVAAGEMYQALETVLVGKVKVEKRMMLKVSLLGNHEQGERPACFALNEVVIAKGNTERVVRLACWADKEYVTTYKADGLIVSTPTGSTAYNLSAGGPIVQSELAAILLTPICPFMLESRPVLLSARTRVTAKLAEPVQDVKVIVDGKFVWDICENDSLIVESAPKPLRLISSPHKGYFEILRNKLNWGGGSMEQEKNSHL